MTKPTTKDIAKVISHGHAFTKHVLSRAEFTDSRFGRPITEIQTATNLQQHIIDTLKSPATKGIREPQTGAALFYNSKTNTFIIMNPNDSQNDFGSVYRPENKTVYWKNKVAAIRKASKGQKFSLTTTPNEHQQLITKFATRIDESKRHRTLFQMRLQERSQTDFARTLSSIFSPPQADPTPRSYSYTPSTLLAQTFKGRTEETPNNPAPAIQKTQRPTISLKRFKESESTPS